jgi:hypothetical protein
MVLATTCKDVFRSSARIACHAPRRYCNDEMLRIIGRTIEHVIGRSSEQLEGVETEAKMVDGADGEEKTPKGDDQEQHIYLLDIIDASGFLHVGSALSNTFPLTVPADRTPYAYGHPASLLRQTANVFSRRFSEARLRLLRLF